MGGIKGDLNVGRTLTAGRRVNQGFRAQTITGSEQLEKHSANWQRLTASSNQDVILPDATDLPLGWSVIVEAKTSSLDVKTYDDTTPVSRKVVTPDRAYEFHLMDNSTEAGVWYTNFLEESDTLASTRYTHTFDATTSWGTASGGYYTMSIAQSSHTRGLSPDIMVSELVGSDYVKVELDELKTLANGNVEMRVPESPDCRFAGKVVLV